MFNERAEAEVPKLWSPDSKSQLISKDPDVGKDQGREEKGMTKDEIVGWHHHSMGMSLKLWEIVKVKNIYQHWINLNKCQLQNNILIIKFKRKKFKIKLKYTVGSSFGRDKDID